MIRKVLVVSNMYPSKRYPTYGTFVKAFVEQITALGLDIDLSVMHKHCGKLLKVMRYCIFYLKTLFCCILGKYDVIYVHYPSYSAASVLVAKRFKKINIFTNVHGTDVIPISRSQRIMERKTRESIVASTKVIVPSAFFRDVVSSKYEYAKENVLVYPSGGINSQIFRPYDSDQREMLRDRLGIKKGEFVFGFISRIYKEKGWDIFLKAARIIRNTNDNVCFLIVGSGEDEELLKMEVNNLGLSDCVFRFSGQPREKLVDFYNIIDLFAFPTIAEESLGLVAIEALACGVPVIASDYGAPHYYMIEGENGFKFEKGNSTELAEKAMKYFGMSEKAIFDLRAKAYKSSISFFDTNNIDILKEIFDYEN